MAFEFTDSNFKDTALKTGTVSVVDFWAEWCGPCRMITPIIEELAKDYDGKVTVGKLNVDSNPEVASKYGVRSIPTILFLKDGEVVDKQVGVTSKKVLADKIEALLPTEEEAAPASGPFEFTDANFQQSALDSGKVSVVDFWAPWCGPCRMIGPLISELADEYRGEAVIGKLNVDDNPEVAMKYGVRSIATILFLKNGEIFYKQVGVTSKKVLAEKIDAALAS
jgi:thioredoxin 1